MPNTDVFDALHGFNNNNKQMALLVFIFALSLAVVYTKLCHFRAPVVYSRHADADLAGLLINV